MRAIVRTYVSSAPFDVSLYLEEMELDDELREAIRAGWFSDYVELGGGLKTVTADMLDKATDAELLAIPGIGTAKLKKIRAAVAEARKQEAFR